MSDFDRLKKALERLLAPFLTRLDYAAFYPATVVVQNGDGTLELKSAHPKLPHLSKVAVRYGIPGVEAKLKTGGQVLVSFEAQDPSRPFCIVHDMASVDELAFLGGTAPVARMGDSVNVFFPPGPVPVSGLLAGQPFVGTLVLTTPAPGIITSGRTKLKG
jgi:hypothetical protein